MTMMLFIPVLVHLLHMTSGVIYHLNETEYQRMPPVYTLDEYDSCLADPGGVYCTAHFNLYSDDHNELFQLITEYSEVSSKHFNHSKLDKGICVTKSCAKFMDKKYIQNEVDLRSTLEGCVNESIWREYGIKAKLITIYSCNKHKETSDIDALDWSVAMIFVAIILVNAIASFLDNPKTNSRGFNNEYLSCFSIKKNWNSLLRQSSSPQFESLKGLYGSKTLATLLVTFAHCFLTISTYNEDLRTIEKAYDHRFLSILFSGTMVPQIFFSISGFLMTYVLQTYSEKQEVTWTDIPKVLFYRWWRFSVLNILLIAFVMTWFRHLGSGPLWDVVVAGCTTADCRRYWWTHLLYINNYVRENRFCAFATWYLAADMQLHTLGLVLHMATRRRGRALVLGILTFVGLLTPALHVWIDDLDSQVLLRPEYLRTFIDKTYETIHAYGHTNIICFALGMAAGYIGYDLQKREINLSTNVVCRFISWLIIPAFIGLMLHTSTFYNDGPPPSISARILHSVTHRACVGVLTNVWILGMICKCNDASKFLFKWRGWQLSSKLAFSVYLVHNFFVYYIVGIRRELVTASFAYMMSIFCGVVVVSFLAAVPLHLLVEAPFNSLMKILFLQPQPITTKKNL